MNPYTPLLLGPLPSPQAILQALLLRSPPSVHQLQLVGGEGQHPADVVGNAQGEQGDHQQQEQNPPETQVLDELLPGGAEAGEHALAVLQVGVEQGVALHGAA